MSDLLVVNKTLIIGYRVQLKIICWCFNASVNGGLRVKLGRKPLLLIIYLESIQIQCGTVRWLFLVVILDAFVWCSKHSGQVLCRELFNSNLLVAKFYVGNLTRKSVPAALYVLSAHAAATELTKTTGYRERDCCILIYLPLWLPGTSYTSHYYNYDGYPSSSTLQPPGVPLAL